MFTCICRWKYTFVQACQRWYQVSFPSALQFTYWGSLLVNLGLTDSGGIASQPALRIHCLYLLSTGITGGALTPSWLLCKYWGFELWSSSMGGLYTLSHLFSPLICFSFFLQFTLKLVQIMKELKFTESILHSVYILTNSISLSWKEYASFYLYVGNSSSLEAPWPWFVLCLCFLRLSSMKTETLQHILLWLGQVSLLGIHHALSKLCACVYILTTKTYLVGLRLSSSEIKNQTKSA